MAITNIDNIAAALADVNRPPFYVNRTSISNTVAGTYHSLWRSGGIPVQPAIPTAAATCDKTLQGTFNFASPSGQNKLYLARSHFVNANNGTAIETYDRLAHMGGLNGTLTTAQTVSLDVNALSIPNKVGRILQANFSDVSWFLEWYTDTGGTAVTATVAVTYNDLSTANITISLVATTRAGRLYPIIVPLAGAGKYIQSVNTVTLSATTGTAGNFGVTAARFLTSSQCGLAYVGYVNTWAETGCPVVPDSACLWQVIPACPTTSTGQIVGNFNLIES